jgi:hypothetical protein
MFKDAGAASVTVTTQPGTARFPSIRVMVEADLRGWLPAVGVSLTEEQIRRILTEAEDDLGQYAGVAGRVAFEVPAHIVTARKR